MMPLPLSPEFMIDERQDMCGFSIGEINACTMQVVEKAARNARVGAYGGLAVLCSLELSRKPLNSCFHCRQWRPISLGEREQFVTPKTTPSPSHLRSREPRRN
jgi:hypothetical protein